MSDFTNLLNQLQESAKAQSQSKSSSKTSRNRKRREISTSERHDSRNSDHYHNENDWRHSSLKKKQRGQCNEGIPKDYKDLKINLAFLCIGAQKAGTTWLHQMLKQHSHIFLPLNQKELHFWDWNRSRGLGWYSQQFSSSQPFNSEKKESLIEKFYGEITPCYAVLPTHDIHEIKTLFPNLKLIFFARDLLERTWSALLMELYQNVQGLEAGEFGNTIKTKISKKLTNQSNNRHKQLLEEAHPNRYNDDYFLDRMEHSTHATRSDYATAIRNWLRVFPKETLLIVDYRNISVNPKAVLKQVCLHIMGKEDNKTQIKKNYLKSEKVKKDLMETKTGSERETLNKYLNSLTKDQLSERVNAGVISGPSSNKCPIRPSLEKKMKIFLKPMAQDFNQLLKELGYDWVLDDYSDC